MTKKEFKDLIQKVITSNSSDSAKYAGEVRNVLIQASSAKRNKSVTPQTCEAGPNHADKKKDSRW